MLCIIIQSYNVYHIPYCSFTKGDEEERLTPLQRAFVVEYEEQQCNAPSQFRYFINCGAVLTQHLSLWRDKFVADR